MAALFAVGLRKNSRIKLKINEKQNPLETELLAMIVDHLAMYVWMQSMDGRKGINKPVSIYELLQEGTGKESNIESFDTSDEFERKRQEILG